MGTYEYLCPSNHVTERFVSLADRPEQIPCEHPECQEINAVATRVVSAVRTTFHANDRKAIKRKGH
jgi:hypothetical protein